MGRPRAEPSRRSVAEALVKESDPTKVVAYFCKECGTVYSDLRGTGKDDAERCSQTPRCTDWSCEECGEPAMSPYQWYCLSCLSKRRSAKEDEDLAKAETVIAADEYPDDRPVFYEGDFYPCLEELLEAYEWEAQTIPDRVWAAEPSVFQLDLDDALEAAFERWAEGMGGYTLDDISGQDELRAAVEEFNKGQDITIYWQRGEVVELKGSSLVADAVDLESEEEEG